MTFKPVTLLRPLLLGASGGTVVAMARIGLGHDPAQATNWIWLGAVGALGASLALRAFDWFTRDIDAALARVDAELTREEWGDRPGRALDRHVGPLGFTFVAGDVDPMRALEGNVEVLRARRADEFETYEIGAQTVSSAAPLEFGVVNDAGKIAPIAPATDLGPRLRALELEIQALRGTGPRIDGLRTAREAMDVAREALGVARDCHKIAGHQAEAITELANALELTQAVLDRHAGQIRTLALLDGMDRATAEAGIDG